MSGTSTVPRLCVFRSNKHLYAQVIDDKSGKTLAQFSNLKKKAAADKIGQEIAKKALEKKIQKVVFDRGGYKYHGQIKLLAEGARQGGLKF